MKRSPTFTPKQTAFIRWFCSADVNMNGTEAARRAGYAGNDATLSSMAKENLRKPHIRAEIDERLNSALSETNITVEKILGNLESTRIQAMVEGRYGAAVRCSELQGKYLKMFTEKVEHVQTIDEISTKELVDLLNELIRSGHVDIRALLNEFPPEQ